MGVDIPETIFSISAVLSLPTELVMVMLALRPEVFSVAVTLRIPLTSTSKTHSRTASPYYWSAIGVQSIQLVQGILTARMGGMGARVNSPREVLSSQLTRSPWYTGNWTVCWLSATVETSN